MSDNEAEESEWTNENLKKLFAALNTNGGQHDKIPYSKALKKVNWQKVSFPPFSPEACQQKWMEVLQTMRKTRTLKELIVEAEDTLANPSQRPKRPSPPNAIFLEENWAKFRKQNPKMTTNKLLVLMAQKYKELPDEEKAQYVEKHQRASEEYDRLMVKLGKRRYKSMSEGCKAKLRRKGISTNTPDGDKGAEDDEGLPAKPPSTGYNLFCKEQLKSMAGVSKKSYVSVWAKRWRDLSEKQRKEYSARCAKLKSEYMTRLNEHVTTLSEKEQQHLLKEHGIKTPTKTKGKFYGEPKEPPRSGNAIFCKDQMKVLKEKFPNSRERFIEVSHSWSNLSTKEKLHYTAKVEESMKTYSMELQKWFKTLTPAKQQEYVTHNPKKRHYLNVKQSEVDNRKEEQRLNRTSDSEDEVIEDSSSDGEEDNYVSAEDEGEKEDGDDVIMFDMY